MTLKFKRTPLMFFIMFPIVSYVFTCSEYIGYTFFFQHLQHIKNRGKMKNIPVIIVAVLRKLLYDDTFSPTRVMLNCRRDFP